MKAWKRQSIAVVYSVIMLLPVVWGEAFFLKRDHSDLEEYVHEETYKVKSIEEAEVMLEKYGYIKGCHVSGRNRRNVPSGLFNIVELDDQKKGDDCSDDRIRDSLIEYQKRFGLPQTGKFDEATQKLMNAKRCGNKDEGELPISNKTKTTESPSTTTDSTQTTQTAQKSRTVRSVNSLLPREAPSEPNGRTGILSKIFPQTSQSPLKRRRRQLEEFKEVLRTGKESVNVVRHPADAVKVRNKRSAIMNTQQQGSVFSKTIVTWRLLSSGYSTKMSIIDQIAVLRLAFRMWSEVIPLQFVLDTNGHVGNVDIEIAFGKYVHLSCNHPFDGPAGEVAHSWVTGDIHFDDEEDYKVDDVDGVQLLKVAVHEIGHVLGLSHILSRTYSIMFPVYPSGNNKDFELGWEDRKEVQKFYGQCGGKFNTIFDWVRRMPDYSMVYNTYFFRDGKYWMYENSANRTRYGDPLNVVSNWKGVPDKLDGYAHVYIASFFDQQTISNQYFFSGEHYYLYSADSDGVETGWPKKIADDFKAKPGQTERIPDNIDTVYFDYRDQNYYFFKGEWVYVYKPFSDGCCERKTKIQNEFPGLTTSDTLPSNLDAVYFSFKDASVYFVKDGDLWINKLYSFSGSMKNGIKKVGKWWEKWFDICEVE